jgi:GAF domain-containing protein
MSSIQSKRVSKELARLAYPWASPRTLERVLEALGQELGAERVLVLENGPGAVPSRRAAEVRFGWSQGGLAGAAKEAFPLRDYAPVWVEELARGRPAWERTSESPLPMRVLLEGQQVQSVLLVPLMVGERSGRWWGLLRVDDCGRGRRWSSREVALAREVGRVLSAMLGQRLASARGAPALPLRAAA